MGLMDKFTFQSQICPKLAIMIERVLKYKLLELIKRYPIITVTGPRQSGKSTLLKFSFPDYFILGKTFRCRN